MDGRCCTETLQVCAPLIGLFFRRSGLAGRQGLQAWVPQLALGSGATFCSCAHPSAFVPFIYPSINRAPAGPEGLLRQDKGEAKSGVADMYP